MVAFQILVLIPMILALTYDAKAVIEARLPSSYKDMFALGTGMDLFILGMLMVNREEPEVQPVLAGAFLLIAVAVATYSAWVFPTVGTIAMAIIVAVCAHLSWSNYWKCRLSQKKVKAYHQDVPVHRVDVRFPVYRQSLTLADVAGMEDVKARLRQVVKKAAVLGVEKPRNGILLYGEPGNGKTMIARALAGEIGLPLISVTAGDLASRFINETTETLVRVFRDATAQAPCVLFFDEFDSLAEDRGMDFSTYRESRQIVNTLLTETVNLRNKGVVLIAATNYLDRLDKAEIREGRFDYKIEIPPPDLPARRAILRAALEQHMLYGELVGESVVRAATRWEGFSIKRLQAVAEEIGEMGRDGKYLLIDYRLLSKALRKVQGRKGSLPENTKSLDQLVFDPRFAQQLRTIAIRMRDMEEVEELGGTVPTGLLFLGELGTGKTETARALAKESGWAFLSTTGNDLIADSREIDRILSIARDIRPCIVFIDEADDILLARSASPYGSVTNKLLTAMDGAAGKVPDVVFIAATNHPEKIDPAALRGGRFTEKLHFEVPDIEAMARFIDQWRAKSRAKFDPAVDSAEIAKLLKGLPVPSVTTVLQDAVNQMIGRSKSDGKRYVSWKDVVDARRTVLGHSEPSFSGRQPSSQMRKSGKNTGVNWSRHDH